MARADSHDTTNLGPARQDGGRFDHNDIDHAMHGVNQMALIALGPTDDMVLNNANCFQKLNTSIAANATDTAPSVIAKNDECPVTNAF
jgi:hypothetical protein